MKYQSSIAKKSPYFLHSFTVFLIIAITFCISAWAKVPTSPAGENYLDLPGDGRYYAAEDDATLDKKLESKLTIEAWTYLREFLPIFPN